ncbi:MAG: hypothetical protein AAF721_08365 [Myxococcota bacterium]
MGSNRRAAVRLGWVAALLASALPGHARGDGPEEAPIVAEPPAEPEDAEDTVIAALQRQGDQRFRADDYAGARAAYLDALGRVPRGPDDAAFRISLIVLVVNATVAEFAVIGDRAPIGEVLDLVEAERASASLDADLLAILDQAAARIEPLLAPLPLMLPATPDGVVVLHSGDVAPQGLDPTLSLIIAGSVTAAAGIAAIGAGAAFKPRATSQVEDSGVAIDDALPFINREIRKGQAWIGVGAGVAAAGIAVLATGVALRLRGRGSTQARLGVAGSRREIVVGLRGRW